MLKDILRTCKNCKLYDGKKCRKFGFAKSPKDVCYHCVRKNSEEEVEEDYIGIGELLDE